MKLISSSLWMIKWRKVALAMSWTICVIVGSSLPAKDASRLTPTLFVGADKVLHFVAYGIMIMLWRIAQVDTKHGSKRVKIALLGLVIVVGLTMEVCQRLFFETRSFEILDIIANIMGAISGFLLFDKFSKNQTYVK